MTTICDHGCPSANHCQGACQPPPRDPSKCRYCREGYSLTNGEHWIVRSVARAQIDIVQCKAGG